jgi:hypothetical protein
MWAHCDVEASSKLLLEASTWRYFATRGQRPRTCPAAIRPSSNAGAGCHDRVLRGEDAQCLLVIGLDNRKAVRVVVSEDRSGHNHVATFEIRAPVGSMATHDLPLRVVIVWARLGRGAIRRRTKVGMQRTLQPRIRQKVKQRDRRCRSARLERTGLKGLFQYRTAVGVQLFGLAYQVVSVPTVQDFTVGWRARPAYLSRPRCAENTR